jgi:hypothetical protein
MRSWMYIKKHRSILLEEEIQNEPWSVNRREGVERLNCRI